MFRVDSVQKLQELRIAIGFEPVTNVFRQYCNVMGVIVA